MAKYLFTISHEAASKAELVEVLKGLQIEFTEIIKNNNYVILDIEKFDPKSLNIGGIYKISEWADIVSTHIFSGEKLKFEISAWINLIFITY